MNQLTPGARAAGPFCWLGTIRCTTEFPSPNWVGELPELKGQGRDLRIDACRGIALWFIFLDHVPNNIGAWLTLRNYGFSDAAEVFIFVSGVTCALAYGKAHGAARAGPE